RHPEPGIAGADPVPVPSNGPAGAGRSPGPTRQPMRRRQDQLLRVGTAARRHRRNVCLRHRRPRRLRHRPRTQRRRQGPSRGLRPMAAAAQRRRRPDLRQRRRVVANGTGRMNAPRLTPDLLHGGVSARPHTSEEKMRRLMYVLLTAVLIGCGSQAAPHATAANAVQRPAPEPLPLPGSEPETSAAADPAARQQAEPALPMPLLVPERPERRAEPAPRPAEDEVLEPTGTLPQGWESGYLRRGPFVYGIFNQERKAFLLLLPVMPAAPGETALQAATLQAAEVKANTAEIGRAACRER